MKKNLYIYIPAVLLVLAVKVFYRTADSDMLLWILAPTTGWVRILSGIPFEYSAQVGYVSHEYRFIIAPSCSGVRFLLLVFVMMVFSYTHLAASKRKKFCWLGFSAVLSYVSTIFVNGIRITVSIYLPLILMDKKLMSDWLTAERLHTIIGTSVYFSMLFVIYYAAGKVCNGLFMCTDAHASIQCPVDYGNEQGKSRYLAVPVFWYFVMVLGIPFAGRLYRNDWTGFLQYALLVTGVCTFIVLVYFMLDKIWRLKS
ncbi:MAG: exosortase K [Lachnospiraceae bacterium]|nr:exosortase K [Lachnospiraceae bacterium]